MGYEFMNKNKYKWYNTVYLWRNINQHFVFYLQQKISRSPGYLEEYRQVVRGFFVDSQKYFDVGTSSYSHQNIRFIRNVMTYLSVFVTVTPLETVLNARNCSSVP